MKDNLGIFFSTLCIIHCMLTPLLAALGLLGAITLDVESPYIHFALVLPVIVIAATSLPSSKKIHGSIVPIALALLGISLMLVTFFLPEEFEVWVMLIAGLTVIVAHVLNKHLLIVNAHLTTE